MWSHLNKTFLHIIMIIIHKDCYINHLWNHTNYAWKFLQCCTQVTWERQQNWLKKKKEEIIGKQCYHLLLHKYLYTGTMMLEQSYYCNWNITITLWNPLSKCTLNIFIISLTDTNKTLFTNYIHIFWSTSTEFDIHFKVKYHNSKILLTPYFSYFF